MLTGENNIRCDMAGERPLTDTLMARSRFLELACSSTGIVKVGNHEAQEEEGECGQEILRKNSLLKLPSFLQSCLESLGVK